MDAQVKNSEGREIVSSTEESEWKKLTEVSETGQFCHFISSRRSRYPIRRVEEDVSGGKVEPDFENLTYGATACCNCLPRNRCFTNKRKYIFFTTLYMGLEKIYRGFPLVVGYFVLGHYKETPCVTYDKCIAFKACEAKFLDVDDCLLLNNERWRKWGLGEALPKGSICIRVITNRTMKTGLQEDAVKEILNHFSTKEDIRDKYIEEIRRVMKAHRKKEKRKYPKCKRS